jgi:hypothetical protein
MVRVEGTLQRIVALKPSAIERDWASLSIKQLDGTKVTLKGQLSHTPKEHDHIIANCSEEPENSYGRQFKALGVVEVFPPRTAEAVQERCVNLLRDGAIRNTPTMKRQLDQIPHNSDFWNTLLNTKSTNENFQQLQRMVLERHKRYAAPYNSSQDVEAWFIGLGLPWSSKQIRKITGHDPDVEDPDRVPLTYESLRTNPLCLLMAPGIGTKKILEYLTALASMNLIDNDTLKVGLLIRDVLDAEADGHTHCPMADSARTLVTNELFAEYLVVEEDSLFLKTTWSEELGIARYVARRLTEHPLTSLYSDDNVESLTNLPVDGDIVPNEDQINAVAHILKEPFSLLIGAAGTGKTTTLRLLCRFILMYAPHLREYIIFLAPTGKAVQRIKDSITDIGLSGYVNVFTIHRYFYMMQKLHSHECSDACSSDTKCPYYDTSCAILVNEPALIVFDESSMISQKILHF